MRQPLQAIGDGHQIAGAGVTGTGTTRQPLQIPHGPQQPAQALAQVALLHQGAHHRLPTTDRGQIHQRCFDPATQAAPPHGGEGAIDRPEQGALQGAVALGGGEFQVAAGLGIQHQGITAVDDPGTLQRHGAGVIQGLGVAQVGQQPPHGPQGEGQLRQAKTIEAGQLVVQQQRGFRCRTAEGGAGYRRQPQPIRTPGRHLARFTPQQFGGRQLGQLLV